MASLDPTAGFLMDDDLFNFTLDDEKSTTKAASPSSLESSAPISGHPDGDNHTRLCPEFVEEELEWLSNKDAFPAIDTCLEILSDHPGIISDHDSPVSVLDSNSSSSSSSSNSNGGGVVSCCANLQVPMTYPVRARSKRRRRRRSVVGFEQSWWLDQVNVKNSKQEWAFAPKMNTASNAIGRRCQHCQADKTPQWRAGPMGPKTLCNACGVRYKSGRLVPEYRPASSPSFSSKLHSNSHRKIMEMRKHKQVGVGGMPVNEACGYRVG